MGRGARRLPLLASLVVAAACGDAPTEPGGDDGPSVVLEVVSGDGQRGLPGWPLSASVLVRVTDGAGDPQVGVPVNFEVTSGGGSVSLPLASSRTGGLASTSWTLGPSSVRTQRLRASTASGDGTGSVTLEATALYENEADLVVVRGALGPLTGFVLLEEVEDDDYAIDVLAERATSDTLLYLPPEGGPGRELVVFARGNRPLRTAPAWTDGVDSLSVELLPPVAVDVRFRVRAGVFEERRSIMLDQLAAMEGIWQEEGVGLVLGDVAFEDLTAGDAEVHVQSVGLCPPAVAGGAIQVDLVTSIDAGRYTGWGCRSGHVFMAEGSRGFPYLLAHELGHTFTLPHTDAGLMYPTQPGREVLEGEIFRAHFHAGSTLNTIFDAQPAADRRTCDVLPLPCLPRALDLERPVAVLAGVGRAPARRGPPVDRDPARVSRLRPATPGPGG